MTRDPYKRAEQATGPLTSGIVWGVVIVGFAVWGAAIFVAGHYALKYW